MKEKGRDWIYRGRKGYAKWVYAQHDLSLLLCNVSENVCCGATAVHLSTIRIVASTGPKQYII